MHTSEKYRNHHFSHVQKKMLFWDFKKREKKKKTGYSWAFKLLDSWTYGLLDFLTCGFLDFLIPVTMPPNWNVFPFRKLHEIEHFRSNMEVTTTGQVDQLLTKEEFSNYSQHILGKVKTAGQGCGLHASSGGSLECQLKTMRLSTHSAVHLDSS